jgi:streptogramin lyase
VILLVLNEAMRLADQQDNAGRNVLRETGRSKGLLVSIAAALFVAFVSSTTASAALDQVTVFRVAGTPGAITAGPDGDLWFVDSNSHTGNSIGRITPAGQVTNYLLPAGSNANEITAGPDGNMWFTELAANKIGRITPTGQITEFALPSEGSQPLGITTGAEGNLWFTEEKANKIGRITPTGQITEFALPGMESKPWSITTGYEGDLWFTEPGFDIGGRHIGRITPTGQITEFPLTNSETRPNSIATGPDGNLWFTEFPRAGLGSGNINRMTPAGQLAAFDAKGFPNIIAAGPDGNLWFTKSKNGTAAGWLDRITPTGQITEVAIPPDSYPVGIASGAEGNLWYSAWIGRFEGNWEWGALPEEEEVGEIARISPGPMTVELGVRALLNRHWAKLKVSCTGGTPMSVCRGRLRLTIGVRRHPSRRNRDGAANSVTIVLARRRYVVPTETSRTIALRFRRRALRLLADHPGLQMHATATVVGGYKTSQPVTLAHRPLRRAHGRYRGH